jgi:mevalonate kinase
MSFPSPNICASAPATLMLAGEHAVLHGHPALVCAVTQRLRVRLLPRTDQLFTIDSAAIGSYEGSLNNIMIMAPFKFVTAIIQSYAPYLTTGFDLQIDSDFSHQVGLGSSAAVTVATIAAFSKWLQQELSAEQLYQLAYKIILQIQQVGSGADVAASVWGGVGFYYTQPFLYQKLNVQFPLVAIYSGSKETTVNVIAKVQALKTQQAEHVEKLFSEIANCTQALYQAIEHENWTQVGVLFDQHYILQTKLGVSNKILETLIQQLRAQPEIYGAKISGSGLGDCIIGVGKLMSPIFPQDPQQQAQGVQQLDLEISQEGVRYE